MFHFLEMSSPKDSEMSGQKEHSGEVEKRKRETEGKESNNEGEEVGEHVKIYQLE